MSERWDPRPFLAALNAQLREDAAGRLVFDTVGAVRGASMTDVIAHHYGAAGVLEKSVVAGRCAIEIDDREREVVLRFEDGHHRTRGREVPFFQGRGASVGTWRFRIHEADLDAWSAMPLP